MRLGISLRSAAWSAIAAIVAIAAIAAIALASALTTHFVLLLLAACGAVGVANAQSSPAFGPLTSSTQGTPAMPAMPGTPSSLSTPIAVEGGARDVAVMPLTDYLGLLRQISPAVELGVRDYLAAFLLRCGREMTTAELHRLLAGAIGDPVLLAHVRAAQLQDPGMRQQLARRLRCPTGVVR